MATALIAAAIASALTLPQPQSPALPDADPAIWVVNDHDTTIFLFGTFHALDGRSDWFNDEVHTAFSSSDELVLETVVPAERPTAPQPGGTELAAPSASFLASTKLAVSAARLRGLKVAKGADTVLRQAAEASGKPVDGLESFHEQLGMFARMPGSAQPVATPQPAQVHGLATLLGRMQSAWNRGEQGLFVAMLDQMQRSSPAGYRMMFTQRNESWASWIASRLDKPGTVFVAVGAGHLAGRDCVQAKLAARGVKSARIN